MRVSGLMGQEASGLTVHSLDGRTPQQTLSEIRARVLAMTAEQSELWRQELLPALEKEGIRIGRIADCSEKELEELAARFEREIYPVLTPLAVGPGQPFPYISALSLSLGVFVRDPKSGEERFARVKVPELLPRFISVGKRHLFLPLEHVITYSLPPCSRRWRSPSARRSGSRGTPTSRSRTKPTTCSKRSSSNCSDDGSETSSASRSPTRCRTRC